MIVKAIKVVDLFADITKKVSEALTAKLAVLDPMISGVHYMHGHPLEIIQTLSEKDKSNTFKFKKYPLIALFQDFPENYFRDPGILARGRFNLIIARGTNPIYKATDRYEHNFTPFLYPIYEEFLKQIYSSGYFEVYSPYNIQHTKIDRLFWGRETMYGGDSNKFNDFLDVIEIRDLELNIYTQNCIKNGST